MQDYTPACRRQGFPSPVSYLPGEAGRGLLKNAMLTQRKKGIQPTASGPDESAGRPLAWKEAKKKKKAESATPSDVGQDTRSRIAL